MKHTKTNSKTIKRPEHNDRKRRSFLSRYGMTNVQWVFFKKDARKEGRGYEIDAKRKKAIR